MATKASNALKGAVASSAPVLNTGTFSGAPISGKATKVSGSGTAGSEAGAVLSTSTGASSATAAQAAAPTTLKTQYEKRQEQNKAQLNALYDKQYQTEATRLKQEYDKNLSDRQAALDRIAPQYQNAANQMALNFEKQRRNANMAALNSGLNTGKALQQQNAYSQKWLSNYGDLRSEEAGAINSANQAIADLKTGYNNALVNARSAINDQRDQALVSAYNKDREWYENQAQILAQNGDFTAYKDLYGAQQAKVARNTWIAKNPEAALNSGMISKKQYKKLTGRDYDPKAKK